MSIFLYTDIEKATTKWRKYQNRVDKAIKDYRERLGQIIKRHKGMVFRQDGDIVLAAFDDGDPINCAIDIQRYSREENWVPGGLGLRVGVHAGVAEEVGGVYSGPVVDRTESTGRAAWGGQILLTLEVKDKYKMPEGVELKYLGSHLLKDLGELEQIYGLVHDHLEIKEFPPIRSVSLYPNNLSPQPTPFFGREAEKAEITKLLENPDCRLITLVGPGGVGKTRLALHAAVEEIEQYKNGLYLVPLAPLIVISPEFLIFSIAEAIGFSFYSREDPKAQLLSYLREKKMLLILDNFEHVIACADLITDFLIETINLKIIATSREKLNLRNEYLFHVDGMKYPKDETVENVSDYSAVRLFLHTARRAQPTFRMSEKAKPLIIENCRMVGGMPLGIELTASWLKTLSLKEITYEIQRNIDFLKTTREDVPERHRSLRAMFESSWNLLSDDEQGVFKRVSVFRSGFDKEAASNVLAKKLSILPNLIDKSLIRLSSAGRYEMLDVLRLYGEEKLSQDPVERDNARNIHCQHYADFLNQREGLLRKGDRQTLEKIGREIENIRVAWHWGVKKVKIGELERALESLTLFYDMRSWYKEGKEIFRQAADQLELHYRDKGKGEVEKSKLLAKLIANEGMFSQRLSQYEQAKELFHRSLVIFRKINEKKEIAYALNNLGAIAFYQGDYQLAEKLYRESLDIRKEVGDKRGIAASLSNLGSIAYVNGDFKEARQFYQEGLVIQQDMEDRRMMASTLNNLGNLAYIQKDFDEAKRLHQQCFEIFRELGDKWGTALSYNNLGNIFHKSKEHEKARDSLKKSLNIHRKIGDRRGVSFTLINLADVICDMGRHDECREHLRKALKTLMEIHALPFAIEALIIMARLLMKEDDGEQALEILAVAINYPGADKSGVKKAEHLFKKLAESVTEETLSAAKNRASQKSLEDVLQEILKT